MGRLQIWLTVVAVLMVAAVCAVIVATPWLESAIRQKIIDIMEEKYESKVELKDLKVSLFPQLNARAEGLALHRNGRTDITPLVRIRTLSASAGYSVLFRTPKHVSNLRLEGLEIHIPPEGDRPEKSGQGKKVPKVVLDRIVADGTKVVVLPKKAGKMPLEFDIRRLSLHSVGLDRPMQYIATLKNAKPPGDIQANGEFGPWNRDEPGMTPISGKYDFKNADLSVFKGISGILSSTGSFKGQLERIEASGETDTPDFTVRIAGNPIHLKTRYHSVIDGTNGDTLLVPVDAQFLSSTIHASGGVTGTEGQKGKTVSLDVDVSQARLQDILRLAIKSSKNPMTGIIGFKTKLVIPPDDIDIAKKLKLQGQFGIGSAKFVNTNIQQKVNTLSGRARGDTEDSDAENVVSNLRGNFTLDKGMVQFSKLSFSVPGASIQLNGEYGLVTEELNFQGTARMDAKVSEMTTGFKSFLLKAVDPFFHKKGAGAVIPIKITGTREKPSFGLALRRKN